MSGNWDESAQVPDRQLDADTILRQIELKVAMAQYEKVLTALYDVQLTRFLPNANDTTAEERRVMQALIEQPR